jgi:hypothetical protein
LKKGLNRTIHKTPFYSNAKDAPAVVPVFGGKRFDLPVRGVDCLKEFDSSSVVGKY